LETTILAMRLQLSPSWNGNEKSNMSQYKIKLNSARILIKAAMVAIVLLAPNPLQAQSDSPSPSPSEDTWLSIKDNIFDGADLADGAGLVVLETPVRAEDAAVVPVTIKATLPPGDTRSVRRFTLVIDENPAPLAGVFEVAPTSGVTTISTRVRVNSYSYVHAAAELSDGKVYVVKTFVKASGGCSAPALKDADEAKAHIGLLKFKQFKPDGSGDQKTREAQIMIRHPNYSGLQMDQVTRLYIPANFIEELRIWQGNDLILAVNGAIAISEDPNIRFNYIPNGADRFRAEARDTKGRIFKAEWPVESGAM
jgi:sulfur-oxidizing protein SoxY